jgi:glutathione S-transferase
MVSQPARAVAWLLKIKEEPFAFQKVEPLNGDCKTPEYLADFPTGLSPAIKDGEGTPDEVRLAEVTLTARHPNLTDARVFSFVFSCTLNGK